VVPGRARIEDLRWFRAALRAWYVRDAAVVGRVFGVGLLPTIANGLRGFYWGSTLLIFP
jgi:hypothetical protein